MAYYYYYYYYVLEKGERTREPQSPTDHPVV